MTEAEQAAREAILERRDIDRYEVGDPVPCSGVGEYGFPEGMEGYSATTTCTRHDPPCTWTDYALRKHGTEEFQVVLEEDMLSLIATAQVTAALRMALAALNEERGRLN